VPQAIAYFADVENSEEPVSLKGQTWASVKQLIRQKVNDFFRSPPATPAGIKNKSRKNGYVNQ